MKLVSREIDVICKFESNGIPRPIKFRVVEDDTPHVISIDRILHSELEKKAGNKMYVYTCQVTVCAIEKLVVLKYNLDDCRWILFKI